MKTPHNPATFDNAFFDKHRLFFTQMLNHTLIGRFVRSLLHIEEPMAAKIAFIYCNGYSIHLGGDEFRACLWSFNYISIMLAKRFDRVFRIIHWFDIHIANRFCPSLNLGFDSYTVSLDVVVFGTAARGVSSYIDWAESWDDIRLSEGTSSGSNLYMIAQNRASTPNSNGARYCLFQRGIISYNTSFLSYNDVITEAGLRLALLVPGFTSTFVKDKLILTSHDKITSYSNQSNDIVNDDYSIDMFGTTEFCSMTWDEYAVNAPYIRMFYLNAAGLNYIKRKRHTAFAFMVEQDFLNEPQHDPVPEINDDTTYTLNLPPTGVTFTMTYRSREKQIVMMM